HGCHSRRIPHGRGIHPLRGQLQRYALRAGRAHLLRFFPQHPRPRGHSRRPKAQSPAHPRRSQPRHWQTPQSSSAFPCRYRRRRRWPPRRSPSPARKSSVRRHAIHPPHRIWLPHERNPPTSHPLPPHPQLTSTPPPISTPPPPSCKITSSNVPLQKLPLLLSPRHPAHFPHRHSSWRTSPLFPSSRPAH